MKKNTIKYWLLWLVLVTSFILAASLLVINAIGYKLNWQNLALQQTGLISLVTEPRDSQVYVNGVLISKKTPLQIPKLEPGRYDIEVKRTEYRTWSRTVVVEPGLVTSLEHVILFFSEPKIALGTPKDLADLQQVKPETDLNVLANEIYRIKNNLPVLVTRLSGPVKSAIWFPDHQHVVYQVDSQISIAELDGQGVESVMKLDSDEPIKMKFIDSGNTLLFKQSDKVYEVTIR